MKIINILKICLYIVCEFVKKEVVEFIFIKYEIIFSYVDDFGWNVIYYVVKGGDLIILKEFIEKGMDIGCLMIDGKIILYIVCIYKYLEICEYVVKNFFIYFLNVQINNNGLIVVYYLVVEKKEDGSEIKILKIFCECENMDFLVICNNGFNQLEWLIYYLNLELIWEIVSE